MDKRLFVLLELLFGGIILGIIEDVILIKILTNEPVTWSIILVVFLVTLPFAFFGEFVIDKIDFLKIFNLPRKYERAEIFLEFLIFGVILGVVEDVTAFYFAIGGTLTFEVILTATLIAIPFAFIGEFLLDRIDLFKTFNLKKLTWKTFSK